MCAAQSIRLCGVRLRSVCSCSYCRYVAFSAFKSVSVNIIFAPHAITRDGCCTKLVRIDVTTRRRVLMRYFFILFYNANNAIARVLACGVPIVSALQLYNIRENAYARKRRACARLYALEFAVRIRRKTEFYRFQRDLRQAACRRTRRD